MAVETHSAYAKQGAIADFKPDGDSRVARFHTHDSDIRLGMTQLIQPGANREGDLMKRHWVGWLSERRREFCFFQHFFDLFLREQPGTRVLDFGKKRQLLHMKYQNHVVGVVRRWRESRR